MQITTFKFSPHIKLSQQKNWACVRALLSQSLSWLPLFVWVLNIDSQLGGPIFSFWFCLWGGNKNKVTAVHRVISYLAIFFGIYIKTFCVFCQQLTKTFSRKFKNWRFVWNHVLLILTFEKNLPLYRDATFPIGSKSRKSRKSCKSHARYFG